MPDPADEAAQAIVFDVVADTPELFAVEPALAGDVTETKQDLTFVLDVRSSAPLTEVTSAVDGMDIRLKGDHESTNWSHY